MQPEDVFRNANDEIAEKARELAWGLAIPFLCECSDGRCFQRVDLTLAQYDEVRAHPQRYLVQAGHAVSEAFLIEQADRVAFVEKLVGSVS
jgi:hypothetical protein